MRGSNALAPRAAPNTLSRRGGLLLRGELALGARATLVAERSLEPLLDEASLRSVDRRRAHGDVLGAIVASPDPLAAARQLLSMVTSKPRFTEKQGLAFIHTCVLLNAPPPARADMERYFRVTPPSVHRVVVELEGRGLIRRVPHSPEVSR